MSTDPAHVKHLVNKHHNVNKLRSLAQGSLPPGFRTKLCLSINGEEPCRLGSQCQNAHSLAELRVDAAIDLGYLSPDCKTTFCQNFLQSGRHLYRHIWHQSCRCTDVCLGSALHECCGLMSLFTCGNLTMPTWREWRGLDGSQTDVQGDARTARDVCKRTTLANCASSRQSSWAAWTRLLKLSAAWPMTNLMIATKVLLPSIMHTVTQCQRLSVAAVSVHHSSPDIVLLTARRTLQLCSWAEPAASRGSHPAGQALPTLQDNTLRHVVPGGTL